MILCSKDELHRYVSLHSRLPQAFSFLSRPDVAASAPGRVELDGDALYAIVNIQQGKTQPEATLEAHRRYIDIHYVLAGTERMGWKPLTECRSIVTPYNSEKDIEFLGEAPDNWCVVQPGMVALFFPEDAHAPMVSNDLIHKIILKVLL
jgi:biofilm protein TabA